MSQQPYLGTSMGSILLAQTALANATQTNALQLYGLFLFNQISTCTSTNNSCVLPSANGGMVTQIRNDGVAPLNVFAQVGSAINSLANNTAYVMPPGSVASFTCKDGLNWLVNSASGSGNTLLQSESLALSALANNTQTAALQLASNFNQITTCTAVLNSCLLPLNASPGQACKIRNDSATGFSLNVFPQTGGVINGLAANAAFILPLGGMIELIASTSVNWLVAQTNVTSGNSSLIPNVVSITTTTTFTSGDSGKVFMVNQTGGYTCTLPAVATSAGVNYKFIVSTAAAAVVIINAAAATPIVGHAIVGPIAGATINVGAGTLSVRFSTSCVLGDMIELYCNGTNWFALGRSGSNVAATGIIFA